MDAELTPGALIDVPSVPNLRDLGGHATADGRTVRSGVLYRSTALAFLSDDDAPKLDALGVQTVFDLRTEPERTKRPDRVPAEATLVVCDVMANHEGAAPARMAELMEHPSRAEELIGGGKSEALMVGAYRDFATLDSAHEAYRRLFTTLLDDGAAPALFHCTTGKDRTGWAAATMLLLLGVPRDEVFAEYLLTNTYLLPSLKFVFDRFEAAGGKPELLRPILGVDAAYLQAGLDELERHFGTVERYFAEGLGLDAAAQDQLRALLTSS